MPITYAVLSFAIRAILTSKVVFLVVTQGVIKDVCFEFVVIMFILVEIGVVERFNTDEVAGESDKYIITDIEVLKCQV